MQKSEATEYLQKSVKIITSNGFHFTGKVTSITEDTLVILEKFGQRVSIKLSDIIICTLGVQ